MRAPRLVPAAQDMTDAAPIRSAAVLVFLTRGPRRFPPAAEPSLQMLFHLCNIPAIFLSTIFSSDQHTPWKQIVFLRFQTDQRTAEVHMLSTACFFPLIHHLAIDLKPPLKWACTSSDRKVQIREITQQFKNRWLMLSGSLQSRQVLSSSFSSLL